MTFYTPSWENTNGVLSNIITSDLVDDDHLIKIGRPLCIEYERIHIRSTKFDWTGRSEIMVASYIRSNATKNRSMKNVSYYSDRINPVGSILHRRKVTIGPFDSSDYGNPHCYYNRGFTGYPVTLTTKLWELNSYRDLIKLGGLLQKATSAVGTFNPYVEVASQVLGTTLMLFDDATFHRSLAPKSIVELSSDDPVGYYVCVPYLYSAEPYEREDFIAKYSINREGILVDTETHHECPHTYIILNVSNEERPDLLDFDFAADSAELLSQVKSTDNVDNLLQMAKDAYHSEAFDKLIEAINDENNDLVQAYKAKLPEGWLNIIEGVNGAIE